VNAFLGLSFIGLFFVIFAILILPTVFFLLTLQRALSKCSPANRTMTPGLVWLQIIPFFGFIWQFFVVLAVANSLEHEFGARRIPEERKPGQTVGLAMCITRVCTIIPFVGIFAGIASVVLWIVYWVKIAGLSAKLDYAPPAQFSPPPYGPGYSDPRVTGGPPYSSGGYQQSTYLAGARAPGAAAMPAAAQQTPPSAGVPTGAQQASTPAEPTPASAANETVGVSRVTGKHCASCGGSMPTDSAFCPQCGAKVDRAAG
jgi:hypothetical protein